MTGRHQVFLHKRLEIHIRIHGWELLRHHIPNFYAAQTFGNLNLCAAGARRIEQEPTNKSDPQTSKARTAEETPDSQHNENKSDELAHSRSYARGTVSVSGYPPHYRT